MEEFDECDDEIEEAPLISTSEAFESIAKIERYFENKAITPDSYYKYIYILEDAIL